MTDSKSAVGGMGALRIGESVSFTVSLPPQEMSVNIHRNRVRRIVMRYILMMIVLE